MVSFGNHMTENDDLRDGDEKYFSLHVCLGPVSRDGSL